MRLKHSVDNIAQPKWIQWLLHLQFSQITSGLCVAGSREVNDLACEVKGQGLNLKVTKVCE